MSRFYLAALVLLAALVGSAARSTGFEASCHHCGCNCNVRKVCKLVCENKKVTEVNYDVKCEDICLHGHSHKCGCEWIPTCKRVKTIKKLVKIETTKMVPAYKCKVEYYCNACCQKLGMNDAPATPEAALAQVGAAEKDTETR